MADYEFFTTTEVAILMGCSLRFVQSLIARGRLLACKHGHDYLVHYNDLSGFPIFARGRPRLDHSHILGYMYSLAHDTCLTCSVCAGQFPVRSFLRQGKMCCLHCGAAIVTWGMKQPESGELVELHPDGSATVRLPDGQYRLEPPGYFDCPE